MQRTLTSDHQPTDQGCRKENVVNSTRYSKGIAMRFLESVTQLIVRNGTVYPGREEQYPFSRAEVSVRCLSGSCCSYLVPRGLPRHIRSFYGTGSNE